MDSEYRSMTLFQKIARLLLRTENTNFLIQSNESNFGIELNRIEICY